MDDLEALCLRRPATAAQTIAFLSRIGQAETTSRLRVTCGDLPALSEEARARPVTVDQTNASWIVDDTVVVKWHNPPFIGPHPAGERLRQLAEARFTAMPALAAMAEWRDDGGHWTPLATATAFLPGAVDGWTWCVHEARVSLGVPTAELTATTRDGQDRWPAQLGALIARMHLALADDRSTLVAAHGDLHVGQVLRVPDGRLYVVDFDGNPTVSPEERVAHRPCAYDLAGILLSLENVGHVVRHHAGPDLPDADVEAWTQSVQRRLLDAYRDVLHRVRRSDLLDEALIEPMINDQIRRELEYATKFLPQWRYVPEAALIRRGVL